MLADVVEAAQLLPEGIILAGHSLGALIVLQAATRLSPRGLILLAPAAPAGLLDHALPVFPPERPVRPPGEARARKWFMSGSASGDIGAYLARLCAESPALLNECFHAGVAVDPGAIDCPILCVSGALDDSPLHPRGQDEAVAAYYGAALHVVPRSGHCMMLDDGWRHTATAMLDFIMT